MLSSISITDFNMKETSTPKLYDTKLQRSPITVEYFIIPDWIDKRHYDSRKQPELVPVQFIIKILSFNLDRVSVGVCVRNKEDSPIPWFFLLPSRRGGGQFSTTMHIYYMSIYPWLMILCWWSLCVCLLWVLFVRFVWQAEEKYTLYDCI